MMRSLTVKWKYPNCQISTKAAIGHNVEIGDYTYIREYASIESTKKDKVKIGKFCTIAPHVAFITSFHDYLRPALGDAIGQIFQDAEYTSAGKHGDIVVGNDVWIGWGAVIMPKVRIGDGAIISANSVANVDISPYEIVGGCPAGHLKFRFPEERRAQLLKLKWWDWSIDEIKKHKEFFYREG